LSGDLLNNILSDLNIQDTEELRNKLTSDIKAMRKSGNLSLTVFVPAKLRDKFEIAKKWTHEKEMTPSNSNYAFAKFAMANTINMIIDEIERERNAPPVQPEDPETPLEPNIA
jgi:hypothetical protein